MTRDQAVERLAAIVLSASKNGHLHGSVSVRIAADSYPDEWRQAVGWTKLVMGQLGLAHVDPALVERVRDAEVDDRPLAAPASLRARLALADAVLAQLGGGR